MEPPPRVGGSGRSPETSSRYSSEEDCPFRSDCRDLRAAGTLGRCLSDRAAQPSAEGATAALAPKLRSFMARLGGVKRRPAVRLSA
jgi:hypothetical protein